MTRDDVVIALLALAAVVVAIWLAIELDAWWARRRPPGAGALRDHYRRMQSPDGDGVKRLRDRRPW